MVYTETNKNTTDSGNILTDLLIPVIHPPQVVDVEFWLHILFAVKRNERDLLPVVPHEAQCLFDLAGHCIGSPAVEVVGSPKVVHVQV